MKSQCARGFVNNLLPSDTARQVLYRRHLIRNIHLTDNEDGIEGGTDKVMGLVLRILPKA